jgi:hypothetical protein
LNRFVAHLLLTLIGFIPVFLLSAWMTGRDRRSYTVLPPDDQVILAGKTHSVIALAERFKPIIMDSPDHQPPNPTGMWVQVINREEDLTIVYYGAWEDEQHPAPLSHTIYGLYRQVFYGSFQDFEYIELHISHETGELVRVRFETAGPDYAYNEVAPHLVATINRTGDGYSYSITTLDGQQMIPERTLSDSEWLSADGHVTLAVQTWNHVFQLVPSASSLQALDMPLRFLDDESYSRFKFSRRSQGDIATPGNRWTPLIWTVLILILLNGLLFWRNIK